MNDKKIEELKDIILTETDTRKLLVAIGQLLLYVLDEVSKAKQK